MASQEKFLAEVINYDLEAEYMLFLLRGLLSHIKKVEGKIELFSEIFSKKDLEKITKAIGSLDEFLTFVLRGAHVHKGGTHSRV